MTTLHIVLIAAVFVAICGLIGLIFLLRSIEQGDTGRNMSKRQMRKDQAFIMNGFYQAAGEILRETARHHNADVQQQNENPLNLDYIFRQIKYQPDSTQNTVHHY